MSRLFLHVGIHKTGTTAIQTFAAANRQKLFERGLWYPDYMPISDLRQKGHHAFGHSLSGPGYKLSIGQSKALVEYWREKAKENKHDLFLSAEAMSRQLIGKPEERWIEKRRSYVKILAELLDSFEVSVVIVLRRQDNFARSMYQEYINGGPRSGTRWADADLRGESLWALSFTSFRKVLAASILHYLDNLMLFEEMFGQPKVLLFEDLTKTSQLSSSFLEELGLNTEGLVDPGVVRGAPSHRETVMKRSLWPLAASTRRSKWVSRFVKWCTKDVILPFFGESSVEDLWESERARRDFIESYAEENAKIASRYFPNRTLPLFD